MGNVQTENSWERIQQGVRDTERLLGQKQYNLVMVKARQTLEFMVKCLAERSLIVEGDLSDTIDQLFQERFISKATQEHYHKIRILGNKAVHEGDNTPNDANQAYHLLSQEVYTFANDYAAKKRKGTSSGSRKPSSGQTAAVRSRKRQQNKGFDPYDLLKPLAILLIIILAVALVKFLIPNKGNADETTTAESSEAVTIAPTTAPVNEPETTTPAVATAYKTTAGVRVRSQPSTDSSTLVVLDAGTPVEYVGPHDESWAIIKYNGQDAYISAQYLAPQ